jgi:mannosyltransferase
VSSAPAGQHPQPPSPPQPAGTPAPPPAAGQARTSRRAELAATWVPAAVVAAAMALVGWWGIARLNSMGNDEVATHWAALLPLRWLVHLLSNVDAVHGLYYLLMHAWAAVGSTPVIMRIPSVIAMCVAAVLIVILGQRLTGSGWAGLFAGLIMVATPSISYYAQTARSYAMVFACVLGSTLALLYALEAEAAGASRRRRWLGYAGLVALGGYLNEMSLLVLAAHGVTVLLARYGRPVLERWLWAAGGGAAVVAPLVLLSIKEHAAIGWINPPGATDLRILVQDYFGVETIGAGLLILCAVVALLPGSGWRRRGAGAQAAGTEPPWWRSGGVSLPSVAAPLLVLPAGILIIESLILHPLYVDRYVLYGEAGAALLAGGGLYRIGRWLRGRWLHGRWLGGAASRRALIWLPGVIVCVCVLILQIGPQRHVRTPGSRLYDYGGPSRFIGATARPGDGIIFLGKFYRKARLGYPADFRNTQDFAMAESPLRVGNFQGRDKSFTQTLPLMLTYRRIWVYGTRPSPHRPAGLLREESLALLRYFRPAGSHQYHNILVTLWVRR